VVVEESARNFPPQFLAPNRVFHRSKPRSNKSSALRSFFSFWENLRDL
jgi:hypothetical protein